MIVIVDERELVTEGFNSLFDREGVASAGFAPPAFDEWVSSAAAEDLKSIRAFLIGDCREGSVSPRHLRDRTGAPVIALSEQHSLENTCACSIGVDDVVRKPVTSARSRRGSRPSAAARMRRASFTEVGAMRIFMDGRDPEINGEPLPLPRRERRILEFLAGNRGRRVTKTQVFNAIYGIFDEEVEENVVESHISKLRKKLRERLGHDPIDSKRFLGYRLVA